MQQKGSVESMTSDIRSMSNDQILGTFFGIFNWVYQIELPVSYRQQIEQHIRAGWFNNDPSEQGLVQFVVELNDRLNQTPNPDLFRPSIQQHFANEFAIVATVPANKLNDKYRILAVMGTLIESLRPGVTGLMEAHQKFVQETNIAKRRHEALRAIAAQLREEDTDG